MRVCWPSLLCQQPFLFLWIVARAGRFDLKLLHVLSQVSQGVSVLHAMRFSRRAPSLYTLPSSWVTFSVSILNACCWCGLLFTYFMPYPLVFLALLSLSLQVSAVTYCLGPVHAMFPGLHHPPLLANCLAISARMPSLPDPIDELPTALRFHSPSSPFFPQALMHHGNCLVQIAYHSGLHPPSNRGIAIDFIFTTKQTLVEVPLSQASILKIWTAVRSAVDSITDECVSNQEAGLHWDFLDVPEIPRTWYSVSILGFGTQSWSERVRRGGSTALEGHLPDEIGRLPDMFGKTCYEVLWWRAQSSDDQDKKWDDEERESFRARAWG